MAFEDPIRGLLADLARTPCGTPPGHVRVWRSHVREQGFDTDDVAAWVVSHGGYIDPAQRYDTGPAGRSRFERKRDCSEGSYVVPVEALGLHSASPDAG